jgi:NAD(P)-dependent dehydrogenase (short-subunit alcohol dehydrogenase family)
MSRKNTLSFAISSKQIMETNSSSTRVALVTWGSRGIGAAIVRRLIREKMAVAFTYSSAQEKAVALAAEIESEGGRALTIKADSANATELRDAITKTVEAFGRLNILVNNAGTRAPDVGRCNPQRMESDGKGGTAANARRTDIAEIRKRLSSPGIPLQ